MSLDDGILFLVVVLFAFICLNAGVPPLVVAAMLLAFALMFKEE